MFQTTTAFPTDFPSQRLLKFGERGTALQAYHSHLRVTSTRIPGSCMMTGSDNKAEAFLVHGLAKLAKSQASTRSLCQSLHLTLTHCMYAWMALESGLHCSYWTWTFPSFSMFWIKRLNHLSFTRRLIWSCAKYGLLATSTQCLLIFSGPGWPKDKLKSTKSWVNDSQLTLDAVSSRVRWVHQHMARLACPSPYCMANLGNLPPVQAELSKTCAKTLVTLGPTSWNSGTCGCGVRTCCLAMATCKSLTWAERRSAPTTLWTCWRQNCQKVSERLWFAILGSWHSHTLWKKWKIKAMFQTTNQ